MCMVRTIMHKENGLDPRTWFKKAETASGGQVSQGRTARSEKELLYHASDRRLEQDSGRSEKYDKWVQIQSSIQTNAITHAVRLMGDRHGERDESGERLQPRCSPECLYLRLGGPDYKYQVSRNPINNLKESTS